MGRSRRPAQVYKEDLSDRGFIQNCHGGEAGAHASRVPRLVIWKKNRGERGGREEKVRGLKQTLNGFGVS